MNDEIRNPWKAVGSVSSGDQTHASTGAMVAVARRKLADHGDQLTLRLAARRTGDSHGDCAARLFDSGKSDQLVLTGR